MALIIKPNCFQIGEGKPPSNPAFVGAWVRGYQGKFNQRSRQARKRGVDMERVMSGKVASVVDIDKDGGKCHPKRYGSESKVLFVLHGGA